MPTLTYIVPVHNEAPRLAKLLETLDAHFERGPWRHRVVLAENGSRDGSAELCARLAAERPAQRLATRTTRAGLGHGLHMGLEAALDSWTQSDPEGDYLLLTAADLPFGFSDFSALCAALARVPNLSVAIGSKAHPGSQLGDRGGRQLASQAYRLARRAILGMKIGDSQGSIFLRQDTARRIAPRTLARDFFYSTELLFHAERAGCTIIELPVTLQPSPRRSTVKPLRDGTRMLRQLVQLRLRSLGQDQETPS